MKTVKRTTLVGALALAGALALGGSQAAAAPGGGKPGAQPPKAITTKWDGKAEVANHRVPMDLLLQVQPPSPASQAGNAHGVVKLGKAPAIAAQGKTDGQRLVLIRRASSPAAQQGAFAMEGHFVKQHQGLVGKLAIAVGKKTEHGRFALSRR